MKKKFVCTVCGYIYEGSEAPAVCPQCKQPGDKFKEVEDNGLNFVCEHEIGEAFYRYALEEAEHAAKFCELIGDLVWDTKTNLKKRAEAECGACEGKLDIAKAAKAANLDAIHDTVHEMAKDEARHGKGFQGLLKRYFGE